MLSIDDWDRVGGLSRGSVEISTLLRDLEEIGVAREQIQVFEDGVVTHGEYEASVNRAMACVEDGGMQIHGFREEVEPATGLTRFTYSIGPGPESEGDVPDLVWADHCQMAHVFFVDLAYHELNRPTDEEVEARRMALLPDALECLTREGYELDQPAEGESVDDVVRQLMDLGQGVMGCLFGHGVL